MRPIEKTGADENDKIIVYSCVTRGYDRSLKPVKHEDGVSFICFTDNPKLKAPGWSLVPLESIPARAPAEDGHFINRYHKLFPHLLFPEADWSIYIDGNIGFSGKWRDLVDGLEKASAMIAAFSHPAGRTLPEEFAMCHKRQKFSEDCLSLADRQLAFYRSAGIACDEIITENCLLVRNHKHPGLPEAMSLWWNQLCEWTRRDQLSLPYVLRKCDVSPLLLDKDAGIDRSRLTRGRHAETVAVKMKRKWKKSKKAFKQWRRERLSG